MNIFRFRLTDRPTCYQPRARCLSICALAPCVLQMQCKSATPWLVQFVFPVASIFDLLDFDIAFRFCSACESQPLSWIPSLGYASSPLRSCSLDIKTNVFSGTATEYVEPHVTEPLQIEDGDYVQNFHWWRRTTTSLWLWQQWDDSVADGPNS